MKSYKLLHTAAIFFLSNLYIKQGIGSMYVMVDSIARATYSYQERESNENCKMKNSCPVWDSNPMPSAYEAKALPQSYEN